MNHRYFVASIAAVSALAVVMAMSAVLLFSSNSTAGRSNEVSISPNADTTVTFQHSQAALVRPEPISPEITILHFGDIMLDRNVKKQIDKNGEEYLLERLEDTGIFANNDIITANLEGSFVKYKRPTSKSIAFGFDPKLISMLKKYGFNLFTLANNHSQDMTLDGFEENKKYLIEAGIDFYGEQYAVDDDALVIKEIKGKKIAFIGVNDTHAPVSMARVRPLLEKARAADWRIVNVHWGEEYKPVSNERQRQFAHAMIDAGADIIIGHHPHVVQELEVYKNKPILYSLGNFIFDQYFSKETQEGLVVRLTLVNDDRISVRIYPVKGTQSRVDVMSSDDADLFMKAFVDRSRLGAYSMRDKILELF